MPVDEDGSEAMKTLKPMQVARFRGRRLVALCLHWLAWMATGYVGVLGQQAAAPSLGPHYYALQSLETGQVVQRGTTGSGGVAFEQLILAPNTRYRIWVLQAANLYTGAIDVTSPSIGNSLQLPAILLGTDLSRDTDADGLNDDGEFIMGTNPAQGDTDGDGVLDGLEVQQGSDPLSGLAVRTGIIASAETPGNAKDICVASDMAIVADGLSGVSVFNIFNGMNPVLVTQVDTPGDAVSVACGGGVLVAVADLGGGLVVIDMSDPPASSIARQVLFGSAARCVAAADDFAFVGLANGQIAVVDMPSGTELSRFVVEAKPLQELVLAGDYLYALVEGSLHVLSFSGGVLTEEGSVSVPGAINAANGRMRLFVGGEIAYVIEARGYSTVDVNLPAQPQLIQASDQVQFGWKHLVANGSGLGLGAVSPNSGFGGPHNVALYDLSDPAVNNAFITEFETPGVARAVALYNGLAYVADHTAGLQVINYLSYDNLGMAPTIALSTSFGAGVAEEGQLMRVTAAVTDDVQVRNVEFYVDDLKVATDGNFPFEHRFVTPLISPVKDGFTLRARASDTGGNTTWSAELSLVLVPDATPPRVLRVNPRSGALLGKVDAVTAYFSEPVIPTSLLGGAFRVVAAGPDDLPNTADDVLVGGGTLTYRESLNAAVLTFPARLEAGLYRVLVGAPLTDQAGNQPGEIYSWSFRVFGLDDRDADGVPDELEGPLGLDPDNSDSDADGIPDGEEDFDGDGLINAGELVAETDPRIADTDGNGTLDGEEDPDGDSLSHAEEIAAGTNPLVADSDGDGWNDESEVTGGSDPMDPLSLPYRMIVGAPAVSVGLPVFGGAESVVGGVTVARPPISVSVPSFGGVGEGEYPGGTVVALPPVAVGLPAFGGDLELGIGVTVAQPPVSVGLPEFGADGALSEGTTVAQPPVSVGFDPP
ncbi:MAG: hypothetical protein RI897_1060 [Verrucomicrobiota bacterium]